MKRKTIFRSFLAIVIVLISCGFIKTIAYHSSKSTNKDIHIDPIPEICSVNDDSYVSYDSLDTYEILMNTVQNRESHVCIVDDMVTNISWADFHSMPYGAFWMKSWRSTSRYYRNNHSRQDFYFEYYDLTPSQITAMKRQVDEKVISIVSSIPDDASDYEKVLAVHDALGSMVTYDKTYNREHCHDAYGALVNQHAVCSGYSSAFCYILNSMDIPCQIVISDTHAWNSIGDMTRYVDVTWDDWDRTDSDNNVEILYYFFGLDEQINQIESHQIINRSHNCLPNHYTLPRYYEEENYILSSYQIGTITEILRDQYNKGKTIMTILFTDQEAYTEFAERYQSDIWPILREIGYTGEYYEYYYDNDKLTWSFVLGQTIQLDQY
ncbi:MAG: hypothetical protein J6Z43_06605 [Clostridiales bacterium]|nr:hypothetical protein [Clostridiales bacterium]